MQRLKKLFLSELTEDLSHTQRLAYIAMVTAFCVVANMFFEFKFADVQFSLTLFISALAGMIIGPIYGFCACFIGDLVGFLYNSGGFTYMPWIGLAMGVTAFLSGFIMNQPLKFKGGDYIKIAVVCFTTFAVCTVAINTTAFWIVYNMRRVPYTTYLVARLFVQGQIFNSLFNYALLFIIYPIIKKLIRTLAGN